MNKFFKLGLGLMAGVAASIAVYEIIHRRGSILEAGSPFAESAESGED